MSDTDSIFSFLSASSLLGLEESHYQPKLSRTKEFDPVGKSLELFDSNEDSASTMSRTTLAAKLRKERPLKSILKPVSSYGPAGSKNPKSLSRGFMSMMELATMVPEDKPCNELDLSCHVLREDDAIQFRASLPRRISFSDAEKEVNMFQSSGSLSEKEDLWFQKHEIGSFVQNEMSRRRTLGIDSTNLLCPKAGSLDDDEIFKRRLATNMPKGVRR
uniref:Uncharacterized protein n=1 Tax=Ditylum brightwellii TaxID=49249 RepID=A0A6V2CI98_9STRA|mmetsp:Transcript_9983/g.14822  ORF Transcript_9983/g.14822 Transcript_9983/m.14822 type:complete len:217 (-) Transcript_9983:12-662(-)|eukprot:2498600-Ditylum_brightwellii.AAC.1